MISDLIVWASVAFAILFVTAWAASPALREWIERPKHRFQTSLQDFDRTAASDATPSSSSTP